MIVQRMSQPICCLYCDQQPLRPVSLGRPVANTEVNAMLECPRCLAEFRVSVHLRATKRGKWGGSNQKVHA